MKQFFKEHLSLILLYTITIVIIWFIFFLFSLPMDVFQLIFWIMFILLCFYLLVKALQFQRKKQLEETIEDLTFQLAEEKSSNTQQQNALEEYFIMWVHQIKTPITASQLILNNLDSPQSLQLKQELLQIENYTNMALNYLKLANPSADMTFNRVSLDEMIAPLLKKYRVQFIQHRTGLHYVPITTKVITDTNLSSVMLEQLINNALKYAKNKEIWIEFDESNYQLTIRDSGQGIRSEDLPKIFDRGFSGFNGQLNQKASGLGLFLVKMISKRLDQKVNVSSEYGQGTTFTIQFHQEQDSFLMRS